ncbi:MAG: aminopeptidase P family protein, partial [Bacteroidales bacterium]
MFHRDSYINRREALKKMLRSGLVLLPGNMEASFNYPANTYHFRQDSNFLYFFGLDHPDLAGIIDLESKRDYIFGNDVDMEDIIWMGAQPSIKEKALAVGVEKTYPLTKLQDVINDALTRGRTINILPPYRGKNILQMQKWLNRSENEIRNLVSEDLIRAVVKLRSVKDENEIRQIEQAMDTAYDMHTMAMKMAKPGVVEREIAGRIEGIALANGTGVSFPIILTTNGQTLHNHYHGNNLVEGRMMVTDAGAESLLHYASDITRTVPVGGKFEQRQREIYEVVLKANVDSVRAIRPGIPYMKVHLMAAEIIAQGLKDLGLMKGDIKEAVEQGAHALFFPHGLGHMMGLDVHDMEGLGEDNVGYDDEVKRSDQFGLAFLRLGRKLQEGFVLTVEPGIYFIPELIDLWRKEKKFPDYINYDKVENYKDFGGIRIEDDVLVTRDGY